MTDVQPTDTPASCALAALCKTDFEMPEALHACAVYSLGDTAVALVDDLSVWSAWLVALGELSDARMSAQVGLHVSTAEGWISGCPVLLLAGDYPQEVAA